MKIDEKLIILCPICDLKIDQNELRKMHRFWSGLQTIECEGCGIGLRWHRNLHARLNIGVFVFKIGVLITSLSLITFLFKLEGNILLMISMGLILTLLGNFLISIPNQKLKVGIDDLM